MSVNWEKYIPAPIPMKKARPPQPKFDRLHPKYVVGIHDDAKKTSQLFKQKIAADLERLKGKHGTTS